MKGITSLNQLSGKEHNQICQILLGVIVGIPLPDNHPPTHLLGSVRALLDFLYLAQYPVHTSETLTYLKDALDCFHYYKSIFIDLGIQNQFNIPKVHALLHYTTSICLFGTTDNYNTEYTERLHIDLAKDAYHATNHKNEYLQMTRWLEQQEKIHQYQNFIQWKTNATADSSIQLQQYLHQLLPERQLHIAKHPTKKAVSIETVIKEYGATFFREALARFVARMCYPHLSDGQIEHKAGGIFLPTHTVPVYHTLKWINVQTKETLDATHAKPLRMDRQERPVPAQFDTVLIKNVQTSDIVSIQEHQIGQIQVIFSLPEKIKNMLFPSSISLEKHLPYIE